MPIPIESWLPVLFHAALRSGPADDLKPTYSTQHSKSSSTLTNYI